MANSNPWKARIAKTQKRINEMTTGDVKTAQKALHAVLMDGLSRLEQQPDNLEFCRLANAVTAAAREYRSLIELGEIEHRIEELEARNKQFNSTGFSHRGNFA